jgi:hypothetical protein|eukprot:4711714-Prymnesium_polylepis.1
MATSQAEQDHEPAVTHTYVEEIVAPMQPSRIAQVVPVQAIPLPMAVPVDAAVSPSIPRGVRVGPLSQESTVTNGVPVVVAVTQPIPQEDQGHWKQGLCDCTKQSCSKLWWAAWCCGPTVVPQLYQAEVNNAPGTWSRYASLLWGVILLYCLLVRCWDSRTVAVGFISFDSNDCCSDPCASTPSEIRSRSSSTLPRPRSASCSSRRCAAASANASASRWAPSMSVRTPAARAAARAASRSRCCTSWASIPARTGCATRRLASRRLAGCRTSSLGSVSVWLGLVPSTVCTYELRRI